MSETEEIMSACSLCPRDCHVDRNAGKKGFCGEDKTVYLARAALHMWEEPCISGKKGSGAVFFSGCGLRCCFCQNHDIAIGSRGLAVTVERLSEIFLELQEKGAANINLVTPTHFVPQIIEALKCAKIRGLHLPVIYNTGGYESEETLAMLDGWVDAYLPGFKYWDSEQALRYSRAEDYPETVKKAIREMYRQTGACRFDMDGKIQKGVIVRHLLLPGELKAAKRIVQYLYETYGDSVYMSLMNQYTPLETLDTVRYPELGRKVTEKEYDALVDYAIDLGVECAYIQEGDTAEESFIPPFTLEGV